MADFNASRYNNLPVQLTSFIGREREIAQVKGFLSRTRLLTLIGAGGVGKTRLAFEVADDPPAAFVDGVWAVDLAPLADPALVVPNNGVGARRLGATGARRDRDTRGDTAG